MKRFIPWSIVLISLLSTGMPGASRPTVQAESSLPASLAQVSVDKPLVPPGFVPPTSVQAAGWTDHAIRNPTWDNSPAPVSRLSEDKGVAATSPLDLSLASPGGLQASSEIGDWSNEAALACIYGLGPLYNFNLVGSILAKPPPADYLPSVGAFSANLGLKFCAPVLYPPPNILVQNPPSCQTTFVQQRMEGRYSNIMGFPSPFSEILPWTDWGDLDTPDVLHWSTDVAVSASHPGERSGGQVTFHTGVNAVTWRGDTLIHPLDTIFIYIPGLGQERETLRTVLNAGKFIADKTLRFLINAEPNPLGIYNEEIQYVTITDLVPPQVTLTATQVQVEAIEPGGVSQVTYLRALRPTVSASDNCDANPELVTLNAPAFAAVGQTFNVTWQGRDDGPLGLSGGYNTTDRSQTVTVVDTLAPIILAPPDIVTETTSLPAAIPIGHPATFDLADLDPAVTYNACSRPGVVCNGSEVRFPAGKTTVTWTATDASGNASTAMQLINVKSLGSNQAPLANGLTGGSALQAISYEPITITLTAQDPNLDPLWFKIAQQPQNGFFHSPLYPYFIQDYRLANFQNISFTEWCQDQNHRSQYIPTNWPVEASFMAVADDGTLYVHDNGMVFCGGVGDVHVDHRLAVFRPDGTWDQVASSFDTKDIYVDWRNGFIYTTSHNVGGTFDWVRKFDLELNLIDQFRIDYADVVLDEPKQAVMDTQGLIYVTNGFEYSGATQLYVYDTTLDEDPVLVADYSLPGAVWIDLALDSQGNLYASERNMSRVYKFSPAWRNPNNSVTPGELIGWLGKCDFGPGCDIANGRSFGFSCTDAACALNSGSSFSGAGPGQFNFPRGIALDPNDILYVTDYSNLRVQRFTPDGYFAGQAKSECDGSCFVLGDFGYPKQVTVNSSHFYVLDDNVDLLHVFETTPLTRVDDHTASIVYQSDNNFTGIDTFTFGVTDGLASSAPASVQVNVSRNHRPPQADRYLTFATTEDTPIPLPLSGYDPDEPLDTLTYQIVAPPLGGEVSGNGTTFTYSPNPDFAGLDRFTFSAYDGASLSAPETVTVTVTPVNDAPRFPAENGGFAYGLAGDLFDFSRLDSLEALEIGRGYSTLFSVDFYDPDNPDRHTVSINWGDGSLAEPEGKMLDDGTITGPLLSESIYGGSGTVTARHTYQTSGNFNANVCVTDNVMVDADGNKFTTPASVTTCHSLQVAVAPMTDLLVDFEEASDPAAFGADLVYNLALVNNAPDSGTGLTATGIVVSSTLDARLEVVSINPSQGSCTQEGDPAGGMITCNLGSLPPDGSATIQIQVQQGADIRVGDTLLSEASYRLNEANQAGLKTSFETTTIVAPADFIVNSPEDAADAAPGSGGCATDQGRCTLRAAVEEANARPGLQTIALGDLATLLDSAITVQDDLAITGLGATRSSVEGNGSDRLLTVTSGAALTLNDLTLTGGKTTEVGGGLYLADGLAILNRVQVNENHADGAGGGLWINSGSSATLNDSSVSGNSSDFGAGGIQNLGTLHLVNVTVSGNHGQTGGGIASSGSAQLLNVTVANNHAAGSGGGISGLPEAWSLKNTILAGNTAADSGPNCAPGFTSQGFNLVEDLTGCSVLGSTTTNVTGASAGLVSPALNGGATFTHALLGNSPAVDTGACDLPADQRGADRPQDGNLDGHQTCDIGAFEFAPFRLHLPFIRG